MVGTKIFNYMPPEKYKGNKSIIAEFEKDAYDPVLIDDVDTTITSFLKTYGEPPHFDPDDFEDADDKDFAEFDDFAEDESAIINDKENVPSSPSVSSSVEPSEPAGSAPVEPDQSDKDE